MFSHPAHALADRLATLPPLLTYDGFPKDEVPAVKLFTPWANGTWFLTEFDPEDRIAFGYCDLGVGFPELGYVSLDELEALRGPFGLRVEVDLHWSGTLADGIAVIDSVYGRV